MRPPSGTTRVAGVIGDPVGHSRSPAMHNAAFAATGLDWVYVAFPVPAGSGATAVRAMGPLGIAGLNVTMPHKSDAAEACDELSETARLLGAVNTVTRRPDGSLAGDSTDGEGFLRSLRDERVEVTGAECLVIGTGGAARAVALALVASGAAVRIAGQRPDALGEAANASGATPVAWESLDAAAAAATVVVNATPLGMRGERPAFDPSVLGPGQTVADLVYDPVATPLLAAAGDRGCRTVGGLGMLVHQAALAFTLWTGLDAPLDAMRAASGTTTA